MAAIFLRMRQPQDEFLRGSLSSSLTYIRSFSSISGGKNVKRKLTEKMKALKDAWQITYKQYIETTPQAESILGLYTIPKVHKNAENSPYRELHV